MQHCRQRCFQKSSSHVWLIVASTTEAPTDGVCCSDQERLFNNPISKFSYNPSSLPTRSALIRSSQTVRSISSIQSVRDLMKQFNSSEVVCTCNQSFLKYLWQVSYDSRWFIMIRRTKGSIADSDRKQFILSSTWIKIDQNKQIHKFLKSRKITEDWFKELKTN